MKNYLLFLISIISVSTFGQTPGNGVTDIDGNNYSTVIIGNQEWMAQNLKTTKYNDNTTIPIISTNTDWSNLASGAYCSYSNEFYRYYIVRNPHSQSKDKPHIFPRLSRLNLLLQ